MKKLLNKGDLEREICMTSLKKYKTVYSATHKIIYREANKLQKHLAVLLTCFLCVLEYDAILLQVILIPLKILKITARSVLILANSAPFLLAAELIYKGLLLSTL